MALSAAVRHGGLPKWVGWVGRVIGIVIFTPAGVIDFLAAGIWIVVVSILLTVLELAVAGNVAIATATNDTRRNALNTLRIPLPAFSPWRGLS